MYERFQELLKEKGCNTAAVARETGIHPSTFTDWKKGKSKPKTDKLQRIADFFGVQIGYLTGDTEYKTRDEELEADTCPWKSRSRDSDRNDYRYCGLGRNITNNGTERGIFRIKN